MLFGRDGLCSDEMQLDAVYMVLPLKTVQQLHLIQNVAARLLLSGAEYRDHNPPPCTERSVLASCSFPGKIQSAGAYFFLL